MRWPIYGIAGAALSLLAWTLVRRKARVRRVAPSRRANSAVEQEMEDQAVARARSEVASGEYDMQG